MKKQTLLLIAIYLFMLLITFYGFHWEEIEVIIPSLLVLVILLILGFIFMTYVVKQKYEIDENVLHLTKEILHELSIPISTIQANTLMLKRSSKEDKKALKRLQRIEDASLRLERLYEELLYSIKKEIQSVECEKTDLVALVEERVKVMRLLNRNIFLVSLEPTYVLVDRIGFEKMLDNILNNAMKYSPKEKPIEITLKNGYLRVKDYGIGMDKLALKSVYRRYYQVKKSNRGEGIGLALVQAYCKDAKIEIEIESEVGKGTEVSLNLSQILTV